MKPKSKTVMAWAVFNKNYTLSPYGNGKQFQYPIFHSRKEANEWREEKKLQIGEILKVKKVTVKI